MCTVYMITIRSICRAVIKCKNIKKKKKKNTKEVKKHKESTPGRMEFGIKMEKYKRDDNEDRHKMESVIFIYIFFFTSFFLCCCCELSFTNKNDNVP